MQGIHRSSVNSSHKGRWRGALFFYLRLNKRLSKQSRSRWFETPSRSLWRHCNVVRHRMMHSCNKQRNGYAQFTPSNTLKNNAFIKDRAHLSTFKIFIFEKFSCFIVLVVFLVIVQSSELVSVCFCEKITFFLIFLVTTSLRYIWAGLPWGCRPLAG